MKNTLYILLLLLCPVLFVQCQKDETAGVGEEVDVTFTARISDVQFNTKALGDGSKVDKLSVGLFDKHGNLVWRNEDDIQISVSSPATVKVPMFKGREYDVVFWAQSSECTSYNTDDLTAISITYGSGSINDYATIEQLDAFHCLKTGVSHNTADKTITLTRPFTQLNMGVPVSVLEELESSGYSIGSVKLTVGGVADEFNALTGVKSGDKTFTFTFNTLPDGSVKVKNDKGEEIDYKYLATTYLFASEDKVSATLEVFNGNETEPFSTVSYEDTPAEPNERTSIFGNIETPILKWDGNIDKDGVEFEGSKCTIKTPQGLAWLSENPTDSRVLDCDEFILEKSMDMGAKSETPLTLLSIKLPIVEKGTVFDGNGKKLQNININGNSLFADASKLTVKNLTVTNITVDKTSATEVTHVGSLVNILKGGGTFSNVTVKDAVVTTGNGAAGGLVGYIVKNTSTSTSRNELYTVTFDGCNIEGTTVNGTLNDGIYVGLMSGYDNNEKLIFKSNNTALNNNLEDSNSPYKEGNEAVWLAGNDYSDYDGWLGNETYCRGKIYFGGDSETANRYIRKWDGVTKITPLTDGFTKLIYSAFDLASLQGTSNSAVTFKEDVDLGGDGNNKNLFTPISAIDLLDGENHNLFNLNIFYKSWIVGFINGTRIDGTEHKNLNFISSSVRGNMTGAEAQVYVGTLCPYVEKKYKVENINVTDGYVLGLGKLGGLIGFLTVESTAYLDCSNCTVSNTTIENIKGTAEETFVIVTFNPHGEVGGLIGFLQNGAKISECEVKECTINCYGQNDKWMFITIPGRHVNDFIGDIRLDAGQRVDLINNAVSGNSFTNRKKDTHSSKCPIVGKCYRISGTAGTVYIGSTKVF